MSAFGHAHAAGIGQLATEGGEVGVGWRLDRWGAGPFVIRVDGKDHRFEDSDRFGPSKVGKDGAIPANPWWPQRHRFWVAHRCWVRQGRRRAPDGVACLWDAPRPTVIKRLSRRHALVIVAGDEDGGFVEADPP